MIAKRGPREIVTCPRISLLDPAVPGAGGFRALLPLRLDGAVLAVQPRTGALSAGRAPGVRRAEGRVGALVGRAVLGALVGCDRLLRGRRLGRPSGGRAEQCERRQP